MSYLFKIMFSVNLITNNLSLNSKGLSLCKKEHKSVTDKIGKKIAAISFMELLRQIVSIILRSKTEVSRQA